MTEPAERSVLQTDVIIYRVDEFHAQGRVANRYIFIFCDKCEDRLAPASAQGRSVENRPRVGIEKKRVTAADKALAPDLPEILVAKRRHCMTGRSPPRNRFADDWRSQPWRSRL
jgi:hypothetical protein